MNDEQENIAQPSKSAKSTKIEPRLLKGFRDYGHTEQLARQQTFAKIQFVFERFGFLPLSTPVLEYKEILMGKYGEDEKLVYAFKDNGDRDVAMRYDLTVPMARYVAQNQGKLTFPFKRYQIAPMWRADNPQKGRLREFYQCDVDAVGTNSPVADAECIAALAQCYGVVGIEDFEVRLNDRRLFTVFKLLADQDDQQITQIIRSMDKVRKIGNEAVLKELTDKGLNQKALEVVSKWLNVGDGETALTNIRTMAPDLSEVIDDIQNLFKLIHEQGVDPSKIVFDPWLARGADYYTGTIVEVFWKSQMEIGSIGGGGRYDGLIDQFSNQSMPAVGMSFGFDRLFDTAFELGLFKTKPVIKALIINLDDKFRPEYSKLAAGLRAQGINTEMYYSAAKLDKQFKYAESKGIQFAVIIGEEEAAAGKAQLKNLQTREQVELSQAEVIKKLSDG